MVTVTMHRLTFVLGVIVGVLLAMASRKRKAHPARTTIWDSCKVVDMRTQANTMKENKEREKRLAG